MNTIFVSSTFQDMQQERDLLRDRVLPLLKAEIRRYGRNIELCDLRWGVNSLGMERDDSDIKVLQVCFNEIDKSKPYFIVLLGDRYGWIPDESIVRKIMSGNGMQDPEYLGKSVTEMEILYAALKAEKPGHIFFYFRKIQNPSVYHETNPTASLKDTEYIESLKNRILKRFPERVRTYEVTWNPLKKEFDGMDSFCRMVCCDLTQAMYMEYANTKSASVYDTQLHQYESAFSERVYLNQETFLQMTQTGYLHRLSDLMLPDFSKQVCLLVSPNMFGLDQVFSNLYAQWSMYANVIPYCCNQSMQASSLQNMLLYFSDQLRQRLGLAEEEKTPENVTNEFHRLLHKMDESTSEPIVLAIRGVQYLDERDLFQWFPLTQYRHIRFLLSADSSPACPAAFQTIAEAVYLPEQAVLDRRSFIRDYMSFFHKEADNRLCDAILEKSLNKNEQYMELLMQRLIMLSKRDYQIIRDHGDGIEQISSYLISIIEDAPDTMGGLVQEQICLLKQETSEAFVDTSLSVMMMMPFGIDKGLMENFLTEQCISFSSVDMTLLCRRLSFAVRETLDGYYRFLPNSLPEKDSLVSEETLARVAGALESFFRKFDVCSDMQDTLVCYQNNRLFIAARNHNETVLPIYLRRIAHNTESFALLLRRLLSDKTVCSWLRRCVDTLDTQDIEWMLHSLYQIIGNRKWNQDPVLTLPLIEVWKCLIQRTENMTRHEQSKVNYENWFFAVYQTGEMAYLNRLDSAAPYLKRAKAISKEAFSIFKNRIWKLIHGIPMTEEELKMGHDSLPEEMQGKESSVMFGFDSELEDMHMMQLWSAQVRIINNYLSVIYRRNGDEKEAEHLEEESRTITQIADHDPLNKGVREILPGITVVYPDEEIGKPNIHQKQSYKPDHRRNSAIQLSKTAQQFMRENKRLEAMQMLTESSQILTEIYEDGETCQYYDMRDVTEDATKAAHRIRMEAARDLSLNAHGMLGCMNLQEDTQEVHDKIEEMLHWAELYDADANTMQSKGDLEEWYLLSANIYHGFDRHDIYFDRILHDLERFYHFRLEAHKLGEEMDEYVMKMVSTAGMILYRITTSFPERGDDVTQLLQKHSNQCVIANDINSSIQLTRDMEALLEWMWSSSYFWKQPEYSLESLYIFNMDNQSMLWEKYGKWDMLKDYGIRISHSILRLKDAENAESGCKCILRYMKALMRNGNMQRAADYADLIAETFEQYGTKGFRIAALEMYATMIGLYSDAHWFEKAIQCSEKALCLYDEIGTDDYVAFERHYSHKQIENHIEAEYARIHLFRAVTYSCAGQRSAGESCLLQAITVFRNKPELVEYDRNLYSGIVRFLENGLPNT